MTKVFTIVNKKGMEKSRYEIGDRKLVCGFQVIDPSNTSDLKSLNSIEELLSSINFDNDVNLVRLTNKIQVDDIFITIKEIEIKKEYTVPVYPSNKHFTHKGYKAEFIDSEFTDIIYLTNQYPIFLNGNRDTWNLVPKQTDIPAYKLIKTLGLAERYFNLESLCGYLEGNSALDDDLYQQPQEALLNKIKFKLFDELPNWGYQTKRLVKNIDFLTNVKITKHT